MSRWKKNHKNHLTLYLQSQQNLPKKTASENKQESEQRCLWAEVFLFYGEETSPKFLRVFRKKLCANQISVIMRKIGSCLPTNKFHFDRNLASIYHTWKFNSDFDSYQRIKWFQTKTHLNFLEIILLSWASNINQIDDEAMFVQKRLFYLTILFLIENFSVLFLL